MPASRASWEQPELIIPVPPMKSTFMGIPPGYAPCLYRFYMEYGEIVWQNMPCPSEIYPRGMARN
jgi:hypothetical protein